MRPEDTIQTNSFPIRKWDYLTTEINLFCASVLWCCPMRPIVPSLSCLILSRRTSVVSELHCRGCSNTTLFYEWWGLARKAGFSGADAVRHSELFTFSHRRDYLFTKMDVDIQKSIWMYFFSGENSMAINFFFLQNNKNVITAYFSIGEIILWGVF